MSTICILQTRMGSTRLPGKVLKPLLDKPVLYWVMYRLKKCPLFDDVVVATSTLERDNAIEELCQQEGWSCFRGSETDVLDRYYHAACKFSAETVVRITSDTPFIDPLVCELVVTEFREAEPKVDYATNIRPERTYPKGINTEVLTFAALKRAWQEASEEEEREHVTPYIYNNLNLFSMISISTEPNLSEHRWLLDTQADLDFAEKVYGHFGHANFSYQDLLAVIEEGAIEANK